MNRCPHCGSPIPTVRHEQTETVLSYLASGRDKQLYAAEGGDWYLTYGGGEVPWSVVQALILGGLVKYSYNNCVDSFGLERTVDMEATSIFRKKTGDRTLIKYVSDEEQKRLAARAIERATR